METKEGVENLNQIHARLFNHSDREWCTANHQLLNCNDTGLIRGHYMWVNDRSVLSNATKENQETHFKTHTLLELYEDKRRPRQVVMLEHKSGNVLAINQDDDTVIAKEPPKPPSEYKILDEVKEDSPEILFYKTARVPGSELYYFTSFLKDKQRIIGFDPEGKQINTTEVQPDKRESWFSIL